MNMKRHWRVRLGSVLLCAMLGAACNPPAAPTETATPVPPPTETATLEPTETPVPTATATATPLPTSTPTPDAKATAAAHATATVEAALGDINDILEDYGYSTKEGRLGFIHDSLSITVDTYGERHHVTDYPDMDFGNFVLHTDITWNTSSGLAGCYMVFRSDGDLERGRNYQFVTIRLQGLPLWGFWVFNNERGDPLDPEGLLPDGAIDDLQGSTNKIVIVAEDTKFTAYANGERLGTQVSSKLAKGAIAFGAFQESGTTTCEFNHTWVWSLDKE